MKENPTFVVKPNSDEVKGAVFPNIILGKIKGGAFCKPADSVLAQVTRPIKSAQNMKIFVSLDCTRIPCKCNL